MSERYDSYDLVVIGGGSAGLVIGLHGPLLGARIAIVEEARLGGDCTWFGCVPSKALLASANVAAQSARAEQYGLPPVEPRAPVDLGRVMDRVAAVQQQIYDREDSPEVVRAAGSDVITGHGEFVSPRELRVDGRPLRARYYCVATGSRPVVPAIPGLDLVPHYTNETVFGELRTLPARLIVLGAGPIGVELAQAFARLGSAVTLVEVAARVLPGEDADLAAVLHEALRADGVEIRTSTRATRFAIEGAQRCAYLEHDGPELSSTERSSTEHSSTEHSSTEHSSTEHSSTEHSSTEERREVDAVLLATGKRPRVHGLGLEAAGVRFDERQGIEVDARLRTSSDRIFASGDVIGGYQFTHTAAQESSVVMMNALTPLRRTIDYRLVPRVTFTDPEVASVGLSEDEARALHGDAVRAYRFPFARVDRAVVDGTTAGFSKIVTAKRDRIVGAQIVGPAAGELIHEYALAISRGVDAVSLGHAVHAYPTLANGPAHAAGQAFEPRLRRLAPRALLGLYLRWSRLFQR